MKKIFTLILAFAGILSANAATDKDLALTKHSLAFAFDDYTVNGTGKKVKGSLMADDHVLDVTGGTVATNKQKVNLRSDLANNTNSEDTATLISLAKKFGDLGEHLNSLRLKNAQDVIAIKVTEGSTIYVLGQIHSSRYTLFAASADMKTAAPGKQTGKAGSLVASYTAKSDELVYIGSQGGDYFVSYIFVVANEVEGTPMVSVSAQAQDGAGLWYRDVACTPSKIIDDSGDEMPTIVHYTIDGSTPNESSPVYKDPIRCYAPTTVKFQSYDGYGDIIEGADNEGVASFKFDAPTITYAAGSATIATTYANAKNSYSLDDGATYTEGDAVTVAAPGAVIKAKTVIKNGSYATFESPAASVDAPNVTPITEAKTLKVTAGKAVVDEEATATSTTGTVYAIDGGATNADNCFFFKEPAFGAVATAAGLAKYQVPADNESYIKFNGDSRIYFEVGCDSVDVVVECSKNSCKTLEGDAADRRCYVQVSGKTYGNVNGELSEDGKTYSNPVAIEEMNTTIKFGLVKGAYYFEKYSGTGNIMISSIEFTPQAKATAINAIKNTASKTVAIYNLAGQKVSADYKGIVIKNGVKVLNK